MSSFNIELINFIFGEFLAIVITIVLFVKLYIAVLKISKFINLLGKEAESLKNNRKNTSNPNNNYRIVKFPKLVINNMLDINLPKICLICGQQDYKGDFKVYIGAKKKYIKIPLCENHYDILTPVLGKNYNKEILEVKTNTIKFFKFILIFSFIGIILVIIFSIIHPFELLITVIFAIFVFFCWSYIIKFIFNFIILAIFSSRLYRNLQLDFSGDNYFSFKAINDEWIKELISLNPNKEIEIK